jgi:hypothetical protein
VLQSKLRHVGPGDLGTTTALLRDNSAVHGRWEFRLQEHLWEQGAEPFRFRLELVPAGNTPPVCAPKAVTVAAFTVGERSLSFGVHNLGKKVEYQRTLGDAVTRDQAFNMAVEVGRDHITWFRDAKPVGSVRKPDALLGVKLTPRLSLIGGDGEMNGAQIDSDWQRAFSLEHGTQVSTAPALHRTSYAGTCP